MLPTSTTNPDKKRGLELTSKSLLMINSQNSNLSYVRKNRDIGIQVTPECLYPVEVGAGLWTLLSLETAEALRDGQGREPVRFAEGIWVSVDEEQKKNKGIFLSSSPDPRDKKWRIGIDSDFQGRINSIEYLGSPKLSPLARKADLENFVRVLKDKGEPEKNLVREPSTLHGFYGPQPAQELTVSRNFRLNGLSNTHPMTPEQLRSTVGSRQPGKAELRL